VHTSKASIQGIHIRHTCKAYTYGTPSLIQSQNSNPQQPLPTAKAASTERRRRHVKPSPRESPGCWEQYRWRFQHGDPQTQPRRQRTLRLPAVSRRKQPCGARKGVAEVKRLREKSAAVREARHEGKVRADNLHARGGARMGTALLHAPHTATRTSSSSLNSATGSSPYCLLLSGCVALPSLPVLPLNRLPCARQVITHLHAPVR